MFSSGTTPNSAASTQPLTATAVQPPPAQIDGKDEKTSAADLLNQLDRITTAAAGGAGAVPTQLITMPELLKKAREYYAAKDYKQAQSAIGIILSVESNNVFALRLSAQINNKLGQYELSLSSLEQIRTLDPAHTMDCDDLVSEFEDRRELDGQIDNANVMIQTGLARGNLEPSWYFERGSRYFLLGNYTAASTDAKEGMQLLSTHAQAKVKDTEKSCEYIDALLLASLSALMQGNYDDAVFHVEIAASINAEPVVRRIRAHVFTMSLYYTRDNKFKKTGTALIEHEHDAAIQLEEGVFHSLLTASNTKYIAAIEKSVYASDLQKLYNALNLNPEGRFHVAFQIAQHADNLYELEDFEEARKAAMHSVKFAPCALAYVVLSRISLLSHNYDQALVDASEARKISPDSKIFYERVQQLVQQLSSSAATLAMQIGDVKEAALVKLSTPILDFPSVPNYLLDAARLFRGRQLDALHTSVQQTREKKSSPAEEKANAYHFLAQMSLTKFKYAEVKNHADLALKSDPRHQFCCAPMLQRANTLIILEAKKFTTDETKMGLGNLNKAASHFTRNLYPAALTEVDAALKKLGQTAVNIANADAIKPNKLEALLLKSLILIMQDQTAEALKVAQSALALDKDESATLTVIWNCYYLLEDMANCDKVPHSSRQSSLNQIWNLMPPIYAKQHAKAVAFYDKLTATQLQQQTNMQTVGMASVYAKHAQNLLDDNDFSQAWAYAKSSLVLYVQHGNTTNHEAYMVLSKISLRLGHNGNALYYANAASRLNPSQCENFCREVMHTVLHFPSKQDQTAATPNAAAPKTQKANVKKSTATSGVSIPKTGVADSNLVAAGQGSSGSQSAATTVVPSRRQATAGPKPRRKKGPDTSSTEYFERLDRRRAQAAADEASSQPAEMTGDPKNKVAEAATASIKDNSAAAKVAGNAQAGAAKTQQVETQATTAAALAKPAEVLHVPVTEDTAPVATQVRRVPRNGAYFGPSTATEATASPPVPNVTGVVFLSQQQRAIEQDNQMAVNAVPPRAALTVPAIVHAAASEMASPTRDTTDTKVDATAALAPPIETAKVVAAAAESPTLTQPPTTVAANSQTTITNPSGNAATAPSGATANAGPVALGKVVTSPNPKPRLVPHPHLAATLTTATATQISQPQLSNPNAVRTLKLHANKKPRSQPLLPNTAKVYPQRYTMFHHAKSGEAAASYSRPQQQMQHHTTHAQPVPQQSVHNQQLMPPQSTGQQTVYTQPGPPQPTGHQIVHTQPAAPQHAYYHLPPSQPQTGYQQPLVPHSLPPQPVHQAAPPLLQPYNSGAAAAYPPQAMFAQPQTTPQQNYLVQWQIVQQNGVNVLVPATFIPFAP